MALFNESKFVVTVGNVWTGRQAIGKNLEANCGYTHINFGLEFQKVCQSDPEFAGSWRPQMEKGLLLPDYVFTSTIEKHLDSATKRATKIALTDITTLEQLLWVSGKLGVKRMLGVVGIFISASDEVCLKRGIEAGYSEEYAKRRMEVHGKALLKLEQYLREHTDYLIEVDGGVPKQAVWQQVLESMQMTHV
jgi:adenylate kinase family enzyme